MLRLIKIFCSVGSSASWGMFLPKVTPPGQPQRQKKQTVLKTSKSVVPAH